MAVGEGKRHTTRGGPGKGAPGRLRAIQKPNWQRDCRLGAFSIRVLADTGARHLGLVVMQAKTPECVSMALCDEVWTDPVSEKKSVIGISEDTWARRYPGAIPKFWIFAELLGFVGQLPITVRLYRRWIGPDLEEVSSLEVAVYSEGLETLSRLELEVRELLIPEAGTYLLALEVFGTRIATRRLFARVSGESR